MKSIRESIISSNGSSIWQTYMRDLYGCDLGDYSIEENTIILNNNMDYEPNPLEFDKEIKNAQFGGSPHKLTVYGLVIDNKTFQKLKPIWSLELVNCLITSSSKFPKSNSITLKCCLINSWPSNLNCPRVEFDDRTLMSLSWNKLKKYELRDLNARYGGEWIWKDDLEELFKYFGQ